MGLQSATNLQSFSNDNTNASPLAETTSAHLPVAVAQGTSVNAPAESSSAANAEEQRQAQANAGGAVLVTTDQVRRERLKTFQPSADQVDIMTADCTANNGKVSKEKVRQRAEEFSVDESQIKRWYSQFKRKQQNIS